MTVIHPDVRDAMAYADTVQDHLLSALDKMRTLSTERLSEDRAIAVKVDAAGQLVDLWFKPGLLDRRPAKDIAREVTRLVTAAGADSAAAVADLFQQAHQYPSYDEFAAKQKTASPDPDLG
jgi:DNA-binding protein YbaB